MKRDSGATEDGEIMSDLGEAGGCQGEDARNKLNAVRIPLLCGLDSSTEFGLHDCFIDAKQACIFRKMPLGEIHPFALFAKALNF